MLSEYEIRKFIINEISSSNPDDFKVDVICDLIKSIYISSYTNGYNEGYTDGNDDGVIGTLEMF